MATSVGQPARPDPSDAVRQSQAAGGVATYRRTLLLASR